MSDLQELRSGLLTRLRGHFQTRDLPFIIAQPLLLLWAVYWQFKLPPTGYAIAIVSIPTALMAIQGEMRLSHKALWILLILAFLSVELRAIGKANDDFAKDRKEANDNFAAISGALASTADQYSRQTDLIKGLYQADKWTVQIRQTLSSGSLSKRDDAQKRGVDLSREILQFLYQREQGTPPRPPIYGIQASNEYESTLFTYRAETVRRYHSTYDNSVSLYLESLAALGVDTKNLKNLANEPQQVNLIRVLAEQLGRSAMELSKKSP